jgi:hypothetical protein
MRSSAVIAGIAGAFACNTVVTTPAPRVGATEMQPTEAQSFTFAPPPSHVIWTERRTFDVSLAGTPVTEHDESELRWDLSTRRSLYDTTVVDQYPLHIAASHDGLGIAEGTPAPVNVQLVIDSGGNLQDIRNLDSASLALRSLAVPGMGHRTANLLSPEALRTIVVTRHDLFIGDVVGRPAYVGATWIVPRRPSGTAILRRYTVEGARTCAGERVCTPLRVHIDLDPEIIHEVAIGAVERHSGTRGDLRPRLRGATYSMDGEVFVDPRTMATLGATLTDIGRAIVEVPEGGAFEVDIRGNTTDTFVPSLISMR